MSLKYFQKQNLQYRDRSHVVYELAGVNDTKWVLYWIVYTLFNFLEYFLYDSVKKFGLYCLAKFVFLIWFMIPGPIGGTNLLYNKIIRRSLIYFRVCYTIKMY